MTKINAKHLSFQRVARAQSRVRKGDAPRKQHVASRILAVGGRRTTKHKRRVAHRAKMAERDLDAALGPVDEEEGDEGQGDPDAPEPLPHQARAVAEAVVAARGGRVKGRARKALRAAGLDPRRAGAVVGAGGKKPRGKAAAAIAAALAARDAAAAAGKGGGAGGGAAGAATAKAAAAAAGGDEMEE
jgi:hypothetical protein